MLITEGKATISISATEKLSKSMPVFYNPVMKHNRDISILLLKAIPDKKMKICLPLAASGIRGIRFLKELEATKIRVIHLNDLSTKAVKSIRCNLKRNKVRSKVKISNRDANLFMRESEGFDYIDIDPFGTPNPFLDSAVQSISRNGIIAVTATDTAALCGTSPNACKRKYWAVPLHNECMQETGLRILIRKVQLIGAQYGKALNPIYSYSKDHYMRAFFRAEKSKESVDKLLKLHDYFAGGGPMWIGQLWDKNLANAMAQQQADYELTKILKTIAAESKIDVIGFYDLHELCSRHKLRIPKKEEAINAVKKAGYDASGTHFCSQGIKSTIKEKQLVRLIASL